MDILKELLQKTSYTSQEWLIFKKVERHNQLEDLQQMINEMLEDKKITLKQAIELHRNAGIIIEKYDKWLDYDWRETMKEAINYILEDNNEDKE